MDPRYPLKFRIGEFTLFSILLTLDDGPRRAIDLSAGADELAAGLQAGNDGILFKSAEITGQSPAVCAGRRCIRYVPYRFRRYFLDLTTDYETYLQKFSSKSRSTLRRKVRKFEALSGGTIDWKIYRTEDELAEFHRLARDLSARTYQERLLDAGLPEDEAFRTEMLERARNGTALGFLLFLADKPISYLYTPIDDEIVVYAYLGYDQDCFQHSPGTVLQLLAVEWLFSEGGYRAFDFTEGEGDHKAFFSTHHVECADVFALRRTARLRLIVGLHHVAITFSDGLVGLVERLGLKSKIKQFIRRRAARGQASV